MASRIHRLKSAAVFGLLAVAAAAVGQPTAAGAVEEVNLYSNRQPELIQPFLNEFTRQTGIKVNIVFAESGMLERIKAEGTNTPADAVLTADVNRIYQLAEADLLHPLKSAAIDKNIPARYRQKDGLWIGLTTRARIVYASKTRVKPGEVATYEDLTKPHMKGRICTRSGKHEYNIGLLAAVIAEKGEQGAEEWARGVKANLARKPQGNDRVQVKAIKEGICDVALGNTYYMGLMQTNEKEPEQKEWAAAVNVVFATFDSKGTHVNISGAGVTKHGKNRANAVKLLEFLSDDLAQMMYAELNFEYPVKLGAQLSPLVKSWGPFAPQEVNLETIAKNWGLATKIMDRVDFDG
jgi:iron(III) transport system substrate-binding protein